MKAEIAVVGYDYGPVAMELQDNLIFVDMMDVDGDEQFVYQLQRGIERVHCLKERRNLQAYVNAHD